MVFTVGIIFLTLLFCLGLFFSFAPSLFNAAKTFGTIICISSIAPILLYSILIWIDSAIQNKSIKIGFLSIRAAFVQLMGYGFGFLEAWWKRFVKGKNEFAAFEKNFYK